MDIFKLGLRSILGITMPGTILVLIFVYALFSVTFALDQRTNISTWGKDLQVLILVTMFLASYFLGSIMRLNASDNVDKKSAKHLRRHNKPYRWLINVFGTFSRKFLKSHNNEGESDITKSDITEFENIMDQLLDGRVRAEQLKNITNFPKKDEDSDCQKNKDQDPYTDRDKKFDKWILMRDEFPYPVWQFRKFFLYHPPEVSTFFKDYQQCMGFGRGGRGTEFFNYCKMEIYRAGRQLGDAVVEEIHFAEATVRFYAGTYYGLNISAYMLLGLLLFQGIAPEFVGTNPSTSSTLTFKVLNIIVTIFLIVAVFRMRDMILERFRILRLKEVDTVYDAFYLIHQPVESGLTSSTALSPERPETTRRVV